MLPEHVKTELSNFDQSNCRFSYDELVKVEIILKEHSQYFSNADMFILKRLIELSNYFMKIKPKDAVPTIADVVKYIYLSCIYFCNFVDSIISRTMKNYKKINKQEFTV